MNVLIWWLGVYSLIMLNDEGIISAAFESLTYELTRYFDLDPYEGLLFSSDLIRIFY